MWKTEEGSTGRLLQLCGGYFFFYTIYSVASKYFTSSPTKLMSEIEFAVYSTLGGTTICLLIVLGLRWYRLESNRRIQFAGLSLPSELLYIIPSGICTAVIIPTTTLMYSLPISVMVAMIIMRGSVIVISRLVDEIQLRQGILQKKVLWEENTAVVFALLAVAVSLIANMVMGKPSSTPSKNALSMAAGVVILISYIVAYAIRIYLMNYYKNTRGKGVKLDNNGFFALEQISATTTVALFALAVFFLAPTFGWDSNYINQFRSTIETPDEYWFPAVLAGTIFGLVSFFSVFIFMFKGRSATFAGLVNRLTSLVAGTAATLLFQYGFGGKPTKLEDWISLALILVAVAFLTRAENRRAAIPAPATVATEQAKPATA